MDWLLKRPFALGICTQIMWTAADDPLHWFQLKSPRHYYLHKKCTKRLVNALIKRLEDDQVIKRVLDEGNKKNIYQVIHNKVFTFEDRVAGMGVANL